MDEAELLDGLATAARTTWERTVAEHGSRAVWLPEMVMVDDEGVVLHVGLVADVPPGMEVSTADMVMDAALMVVQPSTAWLGVTVDSYICNDPRLNDRVAAGHTTLRRLYDQRMPGVVDCLFVYAVNRRAEQRCIPMPYRVRSGRVQWLSPPDLDGDQMGGRLADALSAAMTRGAN